MYVRKAKSNIVNDSSTLLMSTENGQQHLLAISVVYRYCPLLFYAVKIKRRTEDFLPDYVVLVEA